VSLQWGIEFSTMSHGSTTKYGRNPHSYDGVEVRRIFHTLRSVAIENFNEHFKSIFDGHGQVPSKGLLATRRFALGGHLGLSTCLMVSL
jgi:hypothetical protein